MALAKSSAITGIDITTYLIKDYDRAMKFWRDTMDLAPTWDLPGMGAEFTFDDGTTFGLWKMSDEAWHPGRGIMFRVADLKAAVDHYQSRGVSFEDGGAIEENPGCFMAFGKDSEGNAFILHQRKEH